MTSPALDWHCIDLDFTWTFENSLDFSDVPMLTKDVINDGSTPTTTTRLEEAAKSKIALIQRAGESALDKIDLSLDKIFPRGQQSVENLTRALAHPNQR